MSDTPRIDGVLQSLLDHSRVELHDGNCPEKLVVEARNIERELNAAKYRIITLQVLIDRRWEMMRELETECGTNDVGEAVKFIKGLKSRVRELEDYIKSNVQKP